MSKKLRNPVNMLIARGVNMPQPETVFIGGDMMPERIARALRSIRGATLRAIKLPWGRDVRPGAEVPITLADCQRGECFKLQFGALAREKIS